MPNTEMIVMVAIIAGIATVLIHGFQLLNTAVRHRTLRRLIESNPDSAERLLEQMPDGNGQGGGGDDRLGLILVAVGIAMLGASMTAGATGGWTDYGVGAALFPLLIGAALWIRHAVVERARRREAGK